MEYNLCFNNQKTNKVILTTLKNLENMFFIEYSDSEESSESDNDYNKKILDINDNINLDKLNKFEFVEVPKNYIKDKFLICHAEFESSDKNIRDMVIKVCYDTYLAFVGVSHKYSESIIKHLQEHSLEEHIHRNIDRAPKI
ncbi:2139_t:CDS:2 [Scutellospora calospora]|uniref:2139_t:CDS:1 n=1 Tax=Scutellospora calospora TaxID=85575 RepID=A0ACA9M0T4_9GLOM|nr:2139_t:CDS:2 [Scutellospora calospora]